MSAAYRLCRETSSTCVTRSSTPAVTSPQSAAGAKDSGEQGESAHIVSVETRDFIRATKQEVRKVSNSTRHLKEGPPQSQVLKTHDPG